MLPPLSDLISAGNIGLITAAERFDEEKVFKFISYAVWWIRQGILQTLAEQSRTVRLPLNKIGLLYKISKASRLLQKERFEERLQIPEKNWKFSREDLEKRKYWDDYKNAFQEMLERCTTDYAPWHVIPADQKWYRNMAVAHL